MKNIFNTRKGLILLAQVVAALILVSVLLLSQIGAFAGSKSSIPLNSSKPQDGTPTLLTATNTPETTTPKEESPPPAEGDTFNGNSGGGMSAAYQECQAFQKSTWDQILVIGQQLTDINNQISSLRSSASASVNPEEANSLNSQSDSLQHESDRLSALSSELHFQLFQGHHSFYCGPDGAVRGD